MCVQCSSFLGSCQKESFLFCLSQSTNRIRYTLGIWGGSLNTQKSWVACCCSEDPRYSRQRPTERKRSMHPKLLLSKEMYKGLISVLANLQHSWDLGYSRNLERAEKSWGSCSSYREPAVP